MTRIAAFLLLVGLVSCTKKNAIIGMGVGAGMTIVGTAMFEAGETSPTLSARQGLGALIGVSGLVIGTGSLIALILHVIGDVAPPSRAPFRPTPDRKPPAEQCGVDGSCVPVVPGPPPPPPQQPE